MNLLLHPRTEKSLSAFLHHPSHAVILTGEPGSGKGTVARHMTNQLLADHSLANIMALGQEDKAITIEQVRDVIRFTQLTVPGNGQLKRAIIIENAHRMGQEAQNALLKLFEEPPADTIIILTSPSASDVLSTIRSRAQQIPILPVSVQSSLEYFAAAGHDKTLIKRNYFLSNGCVGLLSALLGSDEHPLVEQIQTAKSLIQSTVFERLTLVEGLSKNRESLDTLLLAIIRVSNAALNQAMQANAKEKVTRLSQTLNAAVRAKNMLGKSPNTKLLLSDLMLNL